MPNKRIRLTDEEFNIIYELRNKHEALKSECEEKGIPIESVKHYWHKSKHISLFAKTNAKTWEDLREDIIKEMKEHSPKYPVINHKKPLRDGHLLVIDLADVHFGKLATFFESGDDYNMEIAQKRVFEGIKGLIDKSSGFVIDQILLVIGNDILHIDSPKKTTTSGTPQDTDGMWYESFIKAKETIIQSIETLIPIADIYVHYDPSNHDYMSGFYLADSISSWFSKSKNVKFNCSISHRKYYRYGLSLIGTTHGDGAKVADLPLLMAQESAYDWAQAKHKYFYIHHLHHKIKNDHIGVTVEALRSPSGTDSWHHRNGYQHAPKAIEGFIHCKQNGQVARISHIF